MVTQEHQPLIDTTIRQFRESFIVDLVRQAESSWHSQVQVIDKQVTIVKEVQVSMRAFFLASQ